MQSLRNWLIPTSKFKNELKTNGGGILCQILEEEKRSKGGENRTYKAVENEMNFKEVHTKKWISKKNISISKQRFLVSRTMM